MGNVLVTGAAGFVGAHLCQALASAGHQVTGLDRVPPEPALARACAEFWTSDLLGDDGAALASCSFATVIHLAGLLPGKGPRGALFAVNVGGTSEIVRRFVSPDTHLVLFSSGLVYGMQPAPFHEGLPCQPLDAYGQSKLAAETVARAGCAARGAHLTILRPSVVYGQGAPAGMLLVSMLRALRRGAPFPMTEGRQWRDFLHVEDLCTAVVGLVDKRLGGVFNLASGESHAVHEVAALVAELTGRGELLAIGQLPYRPDEVFDYRLDAGALRAALGWSPRISLRDGLERLWKELS